MSIKLSNNPTCVLTDADLYTNTQRARMAKNLMAGLPATSGEGDKVLVLDENGDPQLKDYSAGGGGGTTYTAGDGIDITSDIISAKIDGSTITLNASGELQASGGSSSETPCIVDWDTQNAYHIVTAVQAALAAKQPVFAKYTPEVDSYPVYLPLASYGLQEGVAPTMTFIGLDYVSFTRIHGYKLVIFNYGSAKSSSGFGGYFVPDPTDVAIGSTLQIVQGTFGREMSWVAPN